MHEPRSLGSDDLVALIAPLTELVVRAGAAILGVNRGAMKIEGKIDGSPVTEADLAADRIIGDGLARLIPDIPALSEERADQFTPAVARRQAQRFSRQRFAEELIACLDDVLQRPAQPDRRVA